MSGMKVNEDTTRKDDEDLPEEETPSTPEQDSAGEGTTDEDPGASVSECGEVEASAATTRESDAVSPADDAEGEDSAERETEDAPASSPSREEDPTPSAASESSAEGEEAPDAEAPGDVEEESSLSDAASDAAPAASAEADEAAAGEATPEASDEPLADVAADEAQEGEAHAEEAHAEEAHEEEAHEDEHAPVQEQAEDETEEQRTPEAVDEAGEPEVAATPEEEVEDVAAAAGSPSAAGTADTREEVSEVGDAAPGLPARIMSRVLAHGRRFLSLLAGRGGKDGAPLLDRLRASLLSRESAFTLAGVILVVVAGLAVSGIVKEPAQDERQEEPAPHPSAAKEEAEDPTESAASALSAEELLKLAEGAIAAGEEERAARFLEDGLVRTSPDDHVMRSRFFTLLAAVSRRLGRPLHERIFSENGDRLRLKAEDSVMLFEDANEAFGAGEWSLARRLYSRFLLRQGELTQEQRESLVPRAIRMIGEAAYQEWSGGRDVLPGVLAEPEFSFEGDL